MLVVGLFALGSSAEVLSIDAADSGHYTETGFHEEYNESVLVGQIGHEDNRLFLVFDLSPVADPITAARLEIEVPDRSYLSPDASEQLELFDVLVPLSSLREGGDAQPLFFEDLGSGVSYGGASVSQADDEGTFTVPLNAAALEAMNEAAGQGEFALGGAISSLSGTASQQFLAHTHTSARRLRITTLPEPGGTWLVALSIVFLALRGSSDRVRRTVLLGLVAGLVASPELSRAEILPEGHEETELFVQSFDGTRLDLNLCRPVDASSQRPVPVVLHSHGWTSRKNACKDFLHYLDIGIGVVSMTQRGNRGSGGQNHVMDPDFEGRDIVAVIDHIATLAWVTKDDGPGGVDPVLGAIGSSYGGGFQWVGAFSDQVLRDAPTRFNAISPGNTWHDLAHSIAPQGVVRSAMAGALYAAGAEANHLAPWVHEAFALAYAAGSSEDPAGILDAWEEFRQHGAAWFVEQGLQLDVPAFVQQGSRDIVFDFNEGWDNYTRSLSDAARADSLFVTVHNGHNLPNNLSTTPLPYTRTRNGKCEEPSVVDWYRHHLLGEALAWPVANLLMTTADRGNCVARDDLPEPTPVSLEAPQVFPTGPRGAFQPVAVLEGPAALAGIPVLRARVTTSDVDARVFLGLAKGATPAELELLGAQWRPLRVAGPAAFAEVEAELGGVVEDVRAGEILYLVVAPAPDQYAAHTSRTPGSLVVDEATLDLPLIELP